MKKGDPQSHGSHTGLNSELAELRARLVVEVAEEVDDLLGNVMKLYVV